MATHFSRAVLTAGVLAVLLLCLTLSWTTRDAMNHLPALNNKTAVRNPSNSPKDIVDLHPWLAAQELAAMAVTTEEIQYAREAERLADHEVDQAFAGALREAGWSSTREPAKRLLYRRSWTNCSRR